jgi:hypothetical protein
MPPPAARPAIRPATRPATRPPVLSPEKIQTLFKRFPNGMAVNGNMVFQFLPVDKRGTSDRDSETALPV